MSDAIQSGAILSPCRTWRYTLTRSWGDGKKLLFILVNPSTADETNPDPTLTRGIGFAKRLGFDGLVFVNLFAFRTPYPKDMKKAEDPVGPDNDRHIIEQADNAGMIVLAWGTNGCYLGRDQKVIQLLQGRSLHCLGKTKHGFPKHPLYLSSGTELERF